MKLFTKSRQVTVLAVLLFSSVLFASAVIAQDAAWEGLITAGRNALQQKSYVEAENHFEAALEEAERFSSSDPRLGRSYNNLAAVYYAQKDYERAEPLMRRALAQLRDSQGPRDTEVAQTMKNLAALYYLQGNRSEAEALLKQALDILEEAHGPNHAFVATVLSNLAGLYQAEDRYQDAEPLLIRSLKIWESLLGSEHPDVVRSRKLLADVREARLGVPLARPDAAEQDAPVSGALAAEVQPAEPAPVDRADAQTEVAAATEALQQLTKQSIAALDTNPENGLSSRVDDVPRPTLTALRDGAEPASAPKVRPEGDDALQPIVPALEDNDTDQRVAAIDPKREEAAAGVGRSVTSALGVGRVTRDKAEAIVNPETTADDISFSVYLSTLWSMEEAQRYWFAMQDALPDVLQGKRLEIEEIALAEGADPFYRVLLTPFASDPEAQALCDEIEAKLRTHDCNVVVRDKAETAGG